MARTGQGCEEDRIQKAMETFNIGHMIERLNQREIQGRIHKEEIKWEQLDESAMAFFLYYYITLVTHPKQEERRLSEAWLFGVALLHFGITCPHPKQWRAEIGHLKDFECDVCQARIIFTKGKVAPRWRGCKQCRGTGTYNKAFWERNLRAQIVMTGDLPLDGPSHIKIVDCEKCQGHGYEYFGVAPFR